MCLDSAKYLLDVVEMLIEGLAVNQDVIKVNNTTAVSKPLESRFHVPLVYGRRVLQPKGDSKPLVQPPGSHKCSEGLALFIHETLVVGFPLVKCGEPTASPEPIDYILDPWNWLSVCYRLLVELAVVYAQT